jgi:phage baseplate assembly protein W
VVDKVPVGITMPFIRGESGFFKQTYSDMLRGLTNLKMLLMTAKGERPMMPSYGSDLREIIFESNTEGYTDVLLDDAVNDAVDSWMPEVTIISVETEREHLTDPHQVTVKIKFSLKAIPDSIQQLTLDF